jgi:hypothetical protein
VRKTFFAAPVSARAVGGAGSCFAAELAYELVFVGEDDVEPVVGEVAVEDLGHCSRCVAHSGHIFGVWLGRGPYQGL